MKIAGITEAQEIFGGVEQAGDRLGSSSAPVTIQVFNDLQCSSCRAGLPQHDPRPGRTLRPPRRRQAPLPPLLGRRKPDRGRLLRRRGRRPAGRRLAVHLPLLPQPGRSEAAGRRQGLSRLDRQQRRRNERARSGKAISKRTAGPNGVDRQGGSRLSEKLGTDLGIRCQEKWRKAKKGSRSKGRR